MRPLPGAPDRCPAVPGPAGQKNELCPSLPGLSSLLSARVVCRKLCMDIEKQWAFVQPGALSSTVGRLQQADCELVKKVANLDRTLWVRRA